MQTNSMWHTGGREQALATLKAEQHWDIIIAGGGITGAGIAREAARRGLKTLLLERQDFAWGTSSRSSKMVHGGLRYIAAGDIKTTMHSVQERERLMTELPGLVDRMGYLMAHYQGGFPGPFVFNTLLRVYDFFAGKRYRQFFPSAAFQFLSPLIRQQSLLGGTQFADAVTDDSRLVLRVLREAQRDGAVVVNYLGVSELQKDGERVCGAVLTDTLSGESYCVRADVVVNATGAWADQLRGQMQASPRIRPARGSHIVVPSWRLPVAQSFTALHPKDQRPIFIFPWEGRTVVGTTDLDNPKLDNQEARMTRDELNYLLEVARYQFPQAELSESDVISSWAGVRPLVSSGALNPSKEKRDHSVWDDNGLVSVSGGKLTTFRLIALDVLNAARPYIQRFPDGEFEQRLFTPAQAPADARFRGLPGYLQKRLLGHYGAELSTLLAEARDDELELIPGCRCCWAELRYSAGHEAVEHLDDLLLRRTRIGLLVEQGGLIYADRIRRICSEALGWSEARWQQERERYEHIWRSAYSLPE
ncbi:FAD-dependent glycerol-3-phosphate dehydrogenase [Bacterioplanes sanyensis]|uniref:glycerol-3-phosphate dehydrogenase/oxidase n=1 Tax=Bacterioplanes sanyensis TaxID=1249553 RepID=UPI001982F9A3|nr:glycerol-3-phosphate dehydrogenase/oxidase [Bacterioplanes sanyensis]GGY53908.1 FAD-dependent glycerol-3-phosphate dehydrogenase [Bacterioplanes sanyensis]